MTGDWERARALAGWVSAVVDTADPHSQVSHDVGSNRFVVTMPDGVVLWVTAIPAPVNFRGRAG